MFKKPFEVKIDAPAFEVTHDIAISPATIDRADALVEKVEKSAVRTVIIGAAAITTSKILLHVAKTYIK